MVGKGAGGHYQCHRKESDQSLLKWKIINFTNSNAANQSSYEVPDFNCLYNTKVSACVYAGRTRVMKHYFFVHNR